MDESATTHLHQAIRGSERASYQDIEQVLYLLLKAGADPYRPNMENVTVSHIANFTQIFYRMKPRRWQMNESLELREIWMRSLTRANYDAKEVMRQSIQSEDLLKSLHWHCCRCGSKLILQMQSKRSYICCCCRSGPGNHDAENFYHKTLCNLEECFHDYDGPQYVDPAADDFGIWRVSFPYCDDDSCGNSAVAECSEDDSEGGVRICGQPTSGSPARVTELE